MKRWFALLSFVAIVACLDYGIDRARTQSTEPVMVEILSPTNGSVVSSTIDITVNAQSSAAPIVYVDFYRDDVFFKRVYNPNFVPAPTSLAVGR